MTTNPKSRWKPSGRFTLRALLVTITLFMIWGGYHTNRSREERAAEAFFHKRGATIYQGPLLRSKGIGDRIGWCYAKIVQAVWQERFIYQVGVFGSLTPEEVDALAKLPNLEHLMMSPIESTREERIAYLRDKFVEVRAEFPKGALRRILSRHDLKSLALQQWALSNDDCQAIASEKHLEGLGLWGCRVTEEGLAILLETPNLRQVELQYCQVIGSKLTAIRGSPSLERVECQYTPAGVEFATFIGRSPKVKYLCCNGQGVDDRFVSAIGPHPALEELVLGAASITDRSVPALTQMRFLKHVTIVSPEFSRTAKAQLQAQSPLLIVE